MCNATTQSVPQLIVFKGAMWSGKTSAMLALLDRYKYQGKRVVVFKPNIDIRYSKNEVTTHTGWKIPAVSVQSGPDILKHLSEMDEPPHIIAIDELFMLPGAAKAVIWLYRQGFTVIVASLDMSSALKPFPEVEKILPWATTVKTCSAVCVVCGRDAHFTYRTIDNVDEIVVGGKESYEPRCAYCFPGIKTDV
jgi:thymidine kinase